MSLRYNDFIPVLVRAIQEQDTKIEKQQIEIEALKTMVLSLIKEKQ
jgi:hypothetical protein